MTGGRYYMAGNIADSFRNDGKPVVMGILNVTPDSFSDGGKYNKLDAALKHVQEMINDGADIIDVGGESTRPGFTFIEPVEEMSRVCPVIEKIKENFDIPISLDTYKPSVAWAGVEAGADMINDIWGLKWHKDDFKYSMAEVAAVKETGVIIMHNRETAEYEELIRDCIKDLEHSIALAEAGGVAAENIILDPGIGFAKDTEQNLIVMNNLEKICALGYPVLLGTSRKSMIGNTLNLPKDEREEGTIATSVMGLMKGCRIFRVHDVKKNRRALDMTYAIMNSGK